MSIAVDLVRCDPIEVKIESRSLMISAWAEKIVHHAIYLPLNEETLQLLDDARALLLEHFKRLGKDVSGYHVDRLA